MKRFLAYVFVAVAAAGLAGAGVVSAHGFGFGFGTKNLTPDEIASHHQEMFAQQAALLGVSVDEVKKGWAEGKGIFQIAAEQGITKEQLQQRMTDARTAHMKSQFQALVSKGVITQVQADARLKFMESHARGGMGMMMGKGFQFGAR
ncbi:MAG: hypothetical protein HYW65_04705 [Candidatus Liptonbacteria bacterium]|nr:hypothetical protein [Candidatus Liptonbacteria bacterium]